jgi:excisionase family DNA binding protein
MRNPADSELLSVADAANYLGLKAGTLRNWLSAKRLPFVKVGRLTRLRRAALDDYIEQHTIRAAE